MLDNINTIIENESTYYHPFADNQCESQNPLRIQTITQFGINTTLLVPPLCIGNRALGNYDERLFVGSWFPVEVIKVNDDRTLNTHYIAPAEAYLWFAGRRTEKLPNNSYKVHMYGEVITEVSEDKLIRRFETPEELPPPKISCSKLKEMLVNAVSSTNFIVTESSWNGYLSTTL